MFSPPRSRLPYAVVPRDPRHVPLLIACVLILAGCGSPKGVSKASAIVEGETISPAALQRNVAYAWAFYAASKGTVPSAGAPSCRASSGRCHAIERQVLRRMLEERIVLHYARRRGIRLSPADRQHVLHALGKVTTSGTPTADLLSSGRISLAFLRSVLETEILVRKVERVIAGKRALRGDSYELRRVYIFIPAAQSSRAYRDAIDVATTGSLSPGAVTRTGWTASFRLSRSIRKSLAQAETGQYVGPFRRRRSYLVVQLLAHGIHPYGRPARQAAETRYFQLWIARQLRLNPPQCFSPSGGVISCPA